MHASDLAHYENIARGGHRVHFFKRGENGETVRVTLEPPAAPGCPVKRTERVVPCLEIEEQVPRDSRTCD